MLRKIIYIGLILCGFFFTMCHLAALPIKTQTGQLVNGYKTASDMSISNEPTNLGTQPRINSELEIIGKRYEFYNRKYDIDSIIRNKNHFRSLNILHLTLKKALSNVEQRLSAGGGGHTSIFGLVPDNAFFEVQNYTHKLLETRTEFIKCRKGQLDPLNFESKSLNFQKTYELFGDKNVKLYKRIKMYLAFGDKQQDTMSFIDTSLRLIFKMTNECVSLYSAALENDLYHRNIYNKIDTSSRNIEWILEQGRYKEKINTEL